MDGPGEYLPDVTEGITRVEDLPQAKILKRSLNFKVGRVHGVSGRGVI